MQSAFEDLSGAAGVYGGMASPSANLLQGGPMLGSGLLWLSAIALLLVTLGLIIAAKIVLAFLLAVGPIFIGMLLFDADARSVRGLGARDDLVRDGAACGERVRRGDADDPCALPRNPGRQCRQERCSTWDRSSPSR